eukprot:scaffold6430_cov133-Isochrysis_galbana.AAC.2
MLFTIHTTTEACNRNRGVHQQQVPSARKCKYLSIAMEVESAVRAASAIGPSAKADAPGAPTAAAPLLWSFPLWRRAAAATQTKAKVWEYELYGGAQLAPHRLYVFARLLTPPKGVWEGPRAIVHLPRNTRCRFLSPPPCPCAFLASSPRAWEVCLFLC